MDIEASPSFYAYFNHHAINLTLDCGATSPLVKQSVAHGCGMTIQPTRHLAKQADGVTPLIPVGEVHETLTVGPVSLELHAVVVKELSSDILLGVPFLKRNRMVVDHFREKIDFLDSKGRRITSVKCDAGPGDSTYAQVNAAVIRAPVNCTLMPGDFLDIPIDVPVDVLCVEARSDSSHPDFPEPMITRSVAGHIRIPNNTDSPVMIKRHQHLAQVRSVCSPADIPFSQEVSGPRSTCPKSSSYSQEVIIDPDNQLSSDDVKAFRDLHADYDNVFNPRIAKYNDASGKIRASVNIGPVEPPKQKSFLPSYNRSGMSKLQDHMDDLESMGVLAKPEDVGVVVEYVSPSFLQAKPSGGDRFITSFVNLASFAKSPPSKATHTEDVLRFLARWRYIIKTDMTSQFFQLPVTRRSMKYLGVMSPFKGLRVYTRAAMGMPGSTEQLDELMSRVLGELLHEGVAIKIADDLYVGGDFISHLLYNWERTLQCFHNNDLRLKAPKTVICPRRTIVLGWIWSDGSISVSPHKVNPLVSADPPRTVKGLRSWLGAYKHLRACIPSLSSLLSPLESAVAGKESSERIAWSTQLTQDFKSAQEALKSPKTVTVPRPSDRLIITNDGAVKNAGIGSVLYLVRNGETRLGGYFSAKLTQDQQRWLPCEVEALAIAASTQHWGPYIRESHHPVQILTDSKPCVQAFERLKQGKFSNSVRVSTFLSTLSRYISADVSVKHLSASQNLPADYLSRNPISCEGCRCQVCQFIQESEQVSVHSVSVSDILSGKAVTPYSGNLVTWRQAQQDCPKLRRVYSHLQHGTRPTKKTTDLRSMKTYLRNAVIGRDGALVVKSVTPFMPTRNLVVVPEHLLHGLLTALHIQLSHPSQSQLQKVFSRSFYALSLESACKLVTSSCHQCSALKHIPAELAEFSTSDSPAVPGESFASDVLCRARQRILVVRETLTSFTCTRLLASERMEHLRAGIIECISELVSSQGAVVRVDGAPALQALIGDTILSSHHIQLELGRLKNKNKNPVAEKAVQELSLELKKSSPDGTPVSSTDLAVATARLNKRIRTRGLSAYEMLMQRDMYTNSQIDFDDAVLGDTQRASRIQNHGPSARSKAPKGYKAVSPLFQPGDIVHLKDDGDKHCARDRYMVTGLDGDMVKVQKLLGSKFRSRIYPVKPQEIYLASSSSPPRLSYHRGPYDSPSGSEPEEDTEQGDPELPLLRRRSLHRPHLSPSPTRAGLNESSSGVKSPIPFPDPLLPSTDVPVADSVDLSQAPTHRPCPTSSDPPHSLRPPESDMPGPQSPAQDGARLRPAGLRPRVKPVRRLIEEIT